MKSTVSAELLDLAFVWFHVTRHNPASRIFCLQKTPEPSRPFDHPIGQYVDLKDIDWPIMKCETCDDHVVVGYVLVYMSLFGKFDVN